MRDLSPAARHYVLAVWIMAALGLTWAIVSRPWPADQLRLVPLWLGAYALADYVEAVVDLSPDQRIIRNVSCGLLLFLTVVSGAPGILAILGGTVIAALLRRPAWYRSVFNAAARVLIYLTLLGEFRLFQPPDA